MPKPKVLFYFDSGLIDRLHDKLSVKDSISGKKLEDILLSFLAETVTDPTEAALERLTENERRTPFRDLSIVEANHKISLIAQKIKSQSSLSFDSLPNAADYSKKNNQRVFFHGKFDRFETSDLRSNNWLEAAFHEDLLTFKCLPDYIESDNYFKEPQFKAEMICSLSKTPFVNGIAWTGFMGAYFRERIRSRKFRLETFCALLPCKHFVQLKPFAIWF